MSTYRTNCKSCGGPLNIADPKCPFCGIKNINLTDIDLASGEAVNFIFRLPNYIKGADGQEIYLSMLAVPELESVELTSDSSDTYDGWNGVPTEHLTFSRQLNCTLNLRTVQPSESNSLYNLTIK